MSLSPLELIAHAAFQDARASLIFRREAAAEFHSQPRHVWLLAQQRAEDAVIAAANTVILYGAAHPPRCDC